MATMANWIRIELARRARPACPDCNGTGVVTYTARNIHGENVAYCRACVRAYNSSRPKKVVGSGK